MKRNRGKFSFDSIHKNSKLSGFKIMSKLSSYSDVLGIDIDTYSQRIAYQMTP